MAADTAAAAEAAPLSMRLVDTSAQRVLFAEASEDVVDFLFSLLALPVGTVVSLLGEDAMVGCVGNLYSSVDDLDGTYVQPSAAKDALLRPVVVLSPVVSAGGNSLLRLPPPSTFLRDKPKTLFRCGKQCCCNPSRSPFGFGGSGFGSAAQFQFISSTPQIDADHGGDYESCRNYVADTSGTACPSCGRQMTTAMQVVSAAAAAASGGAAAAKGFVQGIVRYTVMDDLRVTPMSSMISSIRMLINTFAVKDLAALQEKTVQLGYSEGLENLKASLQSKTVLTDVFLGKKIDGGGAGA